MTRQVWAAPVWFGLAAAAGIGGLVFAAMTLGFPVGILDRGLPVSGRDAAMAWASPLAGIPCGALFYAAWILARRRPADAAAWNAAGLRAVKAGVLGLGVGAALAGLALCIVLMRHGASPLDRAGATLILPAAWILVGLAIVALWNAWRLRSGRIWQSLAQILWGFFGVVALGVGAPMMTAVLEVDDMRTLVQRYNVLVIFYPIAWLAFAATAAALIYFGVRWLGFGMGFGAVQRNDVNPPSTGNTWPVTYDDSSDIKNRAA